MSDEHLNTICNTFNGYKLLKPAAIRDEKKTELRQKIKDLLIEYGYKGFDKITLKLGENCGIKSGEITKFI